MASGGEADEGPFRASASADTNVGNPCFDDLATGLVLSPPPAPRQSDDDRGPGVPRSTESRRPAAPLSDSRPRATGSYRPGTLPADSKASQLTSRVIAGQQVSQTTEVGLQVSQSSFGRPQGGYEASLSGAAASIAAWMFRNNQLQNPD